MGRGLGSGLGRALGVEGGASVDECAQYSVPSLSANHRRRHCLTKLERLPISPAMSASAVKASTASLETPRALSPRLTSRLRVTSPQCQWSPPECRPARSFHVRTAFGESFAHVGASALLLVCIVLEGRTVSKIECSARSFQCSCAAG